MNFIVIVIITIIVS